MTRLLANWWWNIVTVLCYFSVRSAIPMEYQSTRPITSNVTEFSNDDISNLNLNHSNLHMHLIESFRVVFTLIGMVIGIVGIGFNSALIISSIVKASSRTGLKTRNLIISLGVADICLLVFGITHWLSTCSVMTLSALFYGSTLSRFTLRPCRSEWLSLAWRACWMPNVCLSPRNVTTYSHSHKTFIRSLLYSS